MEKTKLKITPSSVAEIIMKPIQQKYGVRIESWADVNSELPGLRKRDLQRLELQRKYDDGVLTLQKKYIDPQQNVVDEIDYVKLKIREFCDKNRHEMDNRMKKVLKNGEVYYRVKPDSLVILKDLKPAVIIAKIKALGKKYADKYIRIKTEIDKDGIKKDLNEMKIDEKFINKLGLETKQEEGFYVQPNP